MTSFSLKQMHWIYWNCWSFNSYFPDTYKFRVKQTQTKLLFIIDGECLLPGIKTMDTTQNNSRMTPQECLGLFLDSILMIPHQQIQALLKKHEAFLVDLSAFGNSMQALRDQAAACQVRRQRCQEPHSPPDETGFSLLLVCTSNNPGNNCRGNTKFYGS